MKRIAAVSLIAAMAATGAVAQEVSTQQPVVSTQGSLGGTTALAVIGGVTFLALVAAASNGDSSSGTN